MTDDRDSEIILCKGIKMDKNYENVLSYSESDMVSLCRNKSVYTATKTSILGAKANSIDISVTYAVAMYANYMAFKNTSYGNKWIFAFITDVKYLSDSACRITYQIDVWSTWYSSFNIGKAFVEREHVDDDTVGKHTIPEGLETGDFIINSLEELGNTQMNTKYIAMAYSGNPQTFFPSYSSGKQYTGLYTGYNYMILGSSIDAEYMIQGFADNGALDKIYALFTIPKGLIRDSVHWYNGPNASGTDIVEVGDGRYPTFALVPEDPVGSYNEITMLSSTNVNINNSIDTYSPKNNKLFTGEFNYLYATNNCGNDIKFNYEDFIDNTPSFKISGAISIGCAIKLIPLNYKKYNTSQATNATYIYGINACKYPTLGWVGDAYTNWLTQNAINIGTGLATSGMSLLGSAFTGNPLYALGGLMDVTNKLGTLRQHQLVSETGQGNINAGDLTYSSKKMNFTVYRMSIKKEYATVIDGYFSRFGYKINEVKQPNLKTRTKFNFIKIGGSDDLIHGDIPAVALSEINNIFRKGVTIFHDYSDFGNYTVSNPIRSS